MGLLSSASPSTLLQLLQRAAVEHPTQGQILLDQGLDGPETSLPYPTLYSQASKNAGKLEAAGIVTPGKIVIVYFENHLDNIVWTWSVIAAGGVPAILSPLSRDMKTLNGQMENLANLFGTPTIITRQENKPQFELFAPEQVHTVEDVDTQESSLPRKDSLGNENDPDALAVLLFTSGSTGHSKAVEFTHRQLLYSVAAKEQQHSLHSQVNFMSWISFDHSANFCELHLNAMNVGANQISVNSADLVYEPHRYYEILSKYKIGYTFSPNSFLATASKAWRQEESRWKDLEESHHLKYDFGALKVIMVGGEANRVSTMELADAIIREHGAPRYAVKAAYGLSETCSACFYNMRTPGWDLERRNLFASVGHHLPIGIDMRIVNDNLQAVLHGTEGRIQLRGDIIFKRYYNNKEATDACMTSDGWFDTGDLGRLDDGHHLNIVGRSKEILIINGNNYSSFELEEAIESRNVPSLTPTWTATFSVWNNKAGSEGVVVLFNPSDDANEDAVREAISAINEAVLSFASTVPVDVIPLPKAELPKSTIGKLSRQKLKKFYSEGHFDKYKIEQQAVVGGHQYKPLVTPLQETIAQFLSGETGVPMDQLGADVSIMHTGMNSMAYLRLKRSIEVEMGLSKPLPMNLILQPRTIEGLEAVILEQKAKETVGLGVYQPITTLQTGTKTPLFLFPPGGGEFMIWLPLVKYLPDRPVYALRARGLEEGEGVFEDMEDMLDIYETAIRALQPEGPYAFVGLCFGGLAAFELAKRFEAAGDKIALLGGLDNPPWISKILKASDFAAFIVDMLAFHKVIPRDQIDEIRAKYEGIPDHEVAEVIVSDYQTERLASFGLTIDKLRDWNRVNNAARKICKSYVPAGRVSSYELFWVPPATVWKISDRDWQDHLHAWHDYTERLTFHRIAGDHFTMLDEDKIAVFQDALNRLLAERQI